jgi:hypothetical protein
MATAEGRPRLKPARWWLVRLPLFLVVGILLYEVAPSLLGALLRTIGWMDEPQEWADRWTRNAQDYRWPLPRLVWDEWPARATALAHSSIGELGSWALGMLALGVALPLYIEWRRYRDEVVPSLGKDELLAHDRWSDRLGLWGVKVLAIGIVAFLLERLVVGLIMHIEPSGLFIIAVVSTVALPFVVMIIFSPVRKRMQDEGLASKKWRERAGRSLIEPKGGLLEKGWEPDRRGSRQEGPHAQPGATLIITCSCGECADVGSQEASHPFICSECGSGLVLPRSGLARLHIQIVECDFIGWRANLPGWAFAVLWLFMPLLPGMPEDHKAVLGYTEYFGAIQVPLLAFVLLYTMNISDSLRLLASVYDYRPLWFLGTAGLALALGTLLFARPYVFWGWGWIAGIVLFTLGWRASLSTVRTPIRRTSGFFGQPLAEVAVPVGLTADVVSLQDELPNCIFMLRSFVDDRNAVEEFVWSTGIDAGVGGVGIETLEKTVSAVARATGLIPVKLGRKSDAEASFAIETADSKWQAIVAEISEKCRIIVMVPGITAGVVWEVERLIEGDLLHKTLFVFPMESGEATDSRWRAFQGTFAKHHRPLSAIPNERNWDPVVVRCLNDGSMQWFVARHNRLAHKRSQRAYLWSLSVALDQFMER